MTQEALNYASDLRKTDIPKEMLTQVKEILEAVPQVRVDFENPAVAVEKNTWLSSVYFRRKFVIS